MNASGFGWHPNLNLVPVTPTNMDKQGHIRNGQKLKHHPVNNAAIKQKVEELLADPEHPEGDRLEDRTETMKTMEFFENMMSSKLWEEAPNAAKNNPSVSGAVVEKRTYIRTYLRTYICTYARTHARTHVRTYVRTYVREPSWCLGGLWDIPKGVIVKPGVGVGGLHEEVFYLPQKPYSIARE